MFDNTSFGKSLEMLRRGMDVAMLRRDVIANNISNAGVPNYKRSTINFESTLKKALESEDMKPAIEMTVTDPRHIPGHRPMDWKTVEPRRVLDYLTTSKANGNNVDPEEEAMLSLQNQLSYTLMAQAASFEISQVNLALRRG